MPFKRVRSGTDPGGRRTTLDVGLHGDPCSLEGLDSPACASARENGVGAISL